MYAGTCVKNGRHGNMPRDVLYVLPCLEEPPANIMVRCWVNSCIGEQCRGLFVKKLYYEEKKTYRENEKIFLTVYDVVLLLSRPFKHVIIFLCVRKRLHIGKHIMG